MLRRNQSIGFDKVKGQRKAPATRFQGCPAVPFAGCVWMRARMHAENRKGSGRD